MTREPLAGEPDATPHARYRYLELCHSAAARFNGRTLRAACAVSVRIGYHGRRVALWAEKADRPELMTLVGAYLAQVAILDWTNAVSFHYARVRAALERAGTPIGSLDLMIASHAVAEQATIVTNNMRHFVSVPGLKVEEWR